jgi:hypothetical protein
MPFSILKRSMLESSICSVLKSSPLKRRHRLRMTECQQCGSNVICKLETYAVRKVFVDTVS